jgi:ATP-dependent phosphoenolpyruvate carboxykinase
MYSERTFIVHVTNVEQENALIAFFKALKINFEATGKSPYNKDFVDTVLQAEDSIKKGKGKKVSSEEFDNLWKSVRLLCRKRHLVYFLPKRTLLS